MTTIKTFSPFPNSVFHTGDFKQACSRANTHLYRTNISKGEMETDEQFELRLAAAKEEWFARRDQTQFWQVVTMLNNGLIGNRDAGYPYQAWRADLERSILGWQAILEQQPTLDDAYVVEKAEADAILALTFKTAIERGQTMLQARDDLRATKPTRELHKLFSLASRVHYK